MDVVGHENIAAHGPSGVGAPSGEDGVERELAGEELFAPVGANGGEEDACLVVAPAGHVWMGVFSGPQNRVRLGVHGVWKKHDNPGADKQRPPGAARQRHTDVFARTATVTRQDPPPRHFSFSEAP
jgi:hypothetical protein